MTDRSATVDFGAPSAFGSHVFRVEVPAARSEGVVIIEDYGHRGNEGAVPQEEERAILPRRVWSGIAETARREFNGRLKAAGVTPGRWHSGVNHVERLLGKELCVLAWAAEPSTDEQIPVVCSRWSALRPEERWWLFSMTVAEAGFPGDSKRGWRQALHHALSDGEKANPERRRRRPVEAEGAALPLFETAATSAR